MTDQHTQAGERDDEKSTLCTPFVNIMRECGVNPFSKAWRNSWGIFRGISQSAGAEPVIVECRECVNCGHVGIDDMHDTEAHCSNCDWHGPSPSEDVCPGCAQTGTMGAACPKCSDAYRLLCDAKVAATQRQAAGDGLTVWTLVEKYADAVSLYNEAVHIDVGIDKAGKECLAIEKELRTALAAPRQPGEVVAGVPTACVTCGMTGWHEHSCPQYAASAQQDERETGYMPLTGAMRLVREKLARFEECADDGEGCDIGREWFDALTTIGLLARTQRSPARWSMTPAGEAVLAQQVQADAGAVAEVESWTNGSYSRNYKLKWLKDVPAGAKLYAHPSPAGESDAIALLKRLKRDLMHARRFGSDTLQAFKSACSQAEGDIEEWLNEHRAAMSREQQGGE